jgi:cobaltochelatase CobT
MGCDLFMSYTNIKDMRGAVKEFGDHLEWELRQKTGNISLTVFQAGQDIRGGDKWEQIITEQLASARLLLVLLSPTWLRSEWCLKEFKLFLAAERDGEMSRPVVPIIWDKVDESHYAKTSEEARVLAQLRTYQILTWDELKYEDWGAPAAKRAAGKLAEELAPRLMD